MVFLDSNVVVAYLARRHPEHRRAKQLLFRWLQQEEIFVISPQVIAESYRVLTSPTRTEEPLAAGQFSAHVQDLLANRGIKLVSPGWRAVQFALTAAIGTQAVSARIFDLLLYGTMREHGITQLATFNQKDFLGLEGIAVLPLDEASG